MKQRKDGSWYMNVTDNMQPSLKVSGLLLPKSAASKRSPNRHLASRDANKTYILHVRGLPPCGLPVAANCTNRESYGNTTQWEAYQVDKFMKSYLSKNNIKSFEMFRSKAMDDFDRKWESTKQYCDITNPAFYCGAPGTIACYFDSDDEDLVRGVIMTAAIVEFNTFVSILYQTLENVKGSINGYVREIVDSWYKKADSQK